MHTPQISVIMPVYNTPAEYLRSAIDSILSQTFTDFEFIIIDDGSDKNDVADVIRSYTDARIKYFHKPNGGVASALNYGLEYARGEYIARMDSDDISLPHRFETQLAYFKSHPDVSLVGAWIDGFPRPLSGGHQPEHIAVAEVVSGWPLNHPTVMWRRADFEKYGLKYDPAHKCEDYDLWSRAVRVLKIANVQSVLLKYRLSDIQVTATSNAAMSADERTIQQNILSYLTADEKLQSEIYKCICGFSRKYYLFGFVPLIKVKQRRNKRYIYLFHFLPIFTINTGK